MTKYVSLINYVTIASLHIALFMMVYINETITQTQLFMNQNKLNFKMEKEKNEIEFIVY